MATKSSVKHAASLMLKCRNKARDLKTRLAHQVCDKKTPTPMQSQWCSKNITEWSTGLKIGARVAGPPPGPFPGPPGAELGREAAKTRRFPVLPPPPLPRKT
jgi:hypothetical protein